MLLRVSLSVFLLALAGCQAQSETLPSSSKLTSVKVKAIAAAITQRHPNLSAEQHDAVVRSLDDMVFIEGGEFIAILPMYANGLVVYRASSCALSP